MLAYVTGSVAEELLARNVYLVTENRILRGQIKGRIRLTDPERISLASVAKPLALSTVQKYGRDRGACIPAGVYLPFRHHHDVAREYEIWIRSLYAECVVGRSVIKSAGASDPLP
jgi:hypothetical protein